MLRSIFSRTVHLALSATLDCLRRYDVDVLVSR